ncbi:aminomethyl-transferring glycine dehydrogenase subunit GcvPA [Paradesulfitobacterium ferrireducens]|uniref:aminomethyl-transferring glycine dehydrogenase subunit GcvPA n=1 Tax=Paradesulfitobacterium ferrireducens TaxID=2816476 RepID=UPI001A908643|nr:aminomethyl-transferring glycine dehydrogenase subunit GcvPA [Paradesulfitobacterium ferrireducens]
MSKKAYPYIPNAVPEIKTQLLEACGLSSVEEIYRDIPEHLRLPREMNLPQPLLSEYSLRRHVEEILDRNRSCKDYLNFLGAGTWQHYVPAVCDEINGRAEFLTAYTGKTYADHGKWQALFEYQSALCELVDMDITGMPTYDWGQAAATALRMAARITGRTEVVVTRTLSQERVLQLRNYLLPEIEIKFMEYEQDTGKLDLADLKKKVSTKTAAVYFENPSYIGVVETAGEEAARIAHSYGALLVVGVDPISLGVLAPPSHYGADIVCGDLQPLGIHMSFGGGLAGFIATHDEPKYVAEFPNLIYGITRNEEHEEYGFGQVYWERTAYATREKGKEFTGTSAGLWGITAGVYLNLMGPQGMQEVGKTIMQKSAYAKKRLSELKGVNLSFPSLTFKEFVLNFDQTGKSVAEINKQLLEHKIFGGKDLSLEFPELGQSALYCVTEIHTKEDIDKLVYSLGKILERG